MADISNLPKPVDLVYIKIEPSTGADASKAPVVIYHGIYSNKESWVGVATKMAEQTKRTFYCFDVRDHGDSPFTNEFVFRATISDMVHFMNIHKIEKAVMLGHSLGGLIFSRLATLYPNLVEKLILVDIHPKKRLSTDGGPNIVQLYAGMMKKTIEKIHAEKMDLPTAKIYLAEALKPFIKDEADRVANCEKLTVRNGQVKWKFNLDVLSHFIDTLGQVEDVTPSFDGPVLEIYGSLSIFINKDDYESVRKMLPNTQFEAVEGGDHILYRTHPKEFVEKVVPFINA